MVLWVDDDFLTSYVDSFSLNNITLLKAATPDELWETLERHNGKIQLIIMDIMMPIGSNIDSVESKRGLQTGLVLLRQLKSSKFSKIPTLIFTISNDKDIVEWSAKNNVQLLKKQDTVPRDLIDSVKSILRQQ